MEIAIDARMLGASGIGTYLEAMLPRVIDRMASSDIALLGDRHALVRRPWLRSNVRIVPCRARIYGLAEQPLLHRAIPKSASVFWAPHVNVPVAFSGRLVVTVHDVYHLRPEAQVRFDKRAYLRLMYAAIARRADAIACVSRFTAGELERRLRIAPKRMTVIPNGVDPIWHEPVTAPRPHPRPYLLFVGNARPHKNLARLVEAFESVSGRIPHDLLLVGRIDEPMESPRVRRVGTARFEELRALNAHAAGLVLPSLHEGFGLPPLEAMAAGTPALVSRVASLPEVCGEAALYCDPEDVGDIADGIVELALDDHDARIEAGRKHAQSFSWDRSAEAMVALLEGRSSKE